MLILALEHLTPYELADESRNQDGEALDPPSPVEEAEPGACHAGGRRIGERPVQGPHALDLVQLPVKMLHGLVGPQVVHDPPQGLKAVHVDTDATHLAGLGAEPFADERGGDELRHRHSGLVAVQSYRRGGLGH